MSVKEIEAAISRLPAKDVTELMSWLAEHHAAVWDKQIEYDLEQGVWMRSWPRWTKSMRPDWRSRYEASDAPALLAAL